MTNLEFIIKDTCLFVCLFVFSHKKEITNWSSHQYFTLIVKYIVLYTKASQTLTEKFNGDTDCFPSNLIQQ